MIDVDLVSVFSESEVIVVTVGVGVDLGVGSGVGSDVCVDIVDKMLEPDTLLLAI